ncbi:MAG: GTP-binding protein, partial [Candidatus Aminicenantes bacterium]
FNKKSEIIDEIDGICKEIRKIVKRHYNTRFLTQSAVVGLVGRVNVGKSSILNAILEKKRVVVDKKPGTTRDYVEVEVDIEGVSVVLVDTAGVRKRGARTEKKAADLARERLLEADLLLCVGEAGCAIRAEDKENWGGFEKQEKIVVMNKIDLLEKEGNNEDINQPKKEEGQTEIWVSALDGRGIKELKKEIQRRLADNMGEAENLIVTTNRHVACLERAAEALEKAKTGIEKGGPEEINALEVKSAGGRR